MKKWIGLPATLLFISITISNAMGSAFLVDGAISAEENGLYQYYTTGAYSWKIEGYYAGCEMPVYRKTGTDYYIGYRSCATKWVIIELPPPDPLSHLDSLSGPKDYHYGNYNDTFIPPFDGWRERHHGAPEEAAPTVSLAKACEVAGAGSLGSNGIYYDSGRTFNGEPVYVMGDYRLGYGNCQDGSKWVIVNGDDDNHLGCDSAANVLYTNATDSASPPPTGWLADNGANPGPRLVPPPPLLLEVLHHTQTGFQVQLSGAAEAVSANGYKLDISSDPDFSVFEDGFNDLDIGNQIAYSATGLSQNTRYYIRMRAYNSQGESSSSEVMKGTITGNGNFCGPVTQFEDLYVSGAGTASVNGVYTDSGRTFNGKPVYEYGEYRLGWRIVIGTYSNDYYWVIVGGGDDSLIDSGSVLYQIGIGDRTRTDSPPLEDWRVRYGASPAPTLIGLPLAQPTAMPAANIQKTSFTANWTQVVNASGYELDVATNSDFSSSFFTNDVGNVTNYVINGLSPNSAYYYRVRAYHSDSMYESGDSNTLKVTTHANQPGALAFSNAGVNNVQANWSANNNPPGTQYYCEKTGPGGSTNSGWITATFWNLSGLGCESEYAFRVKARNQNGVDLNEWQSLGNGTTGACPPLSVEPPDNLEASGPPGGPFSPSSQSYTMEHSQDIAVAWSATLANDANWVSLSQTQGTLDPGESTGVTFSINTNAHSLPLGTYSETVTFLMDGVAQQSREVVLSVLAEHTLSVTVEPEGAGTVTLDPAGAAYLQGTEVNLTAAPIDPYFEFGNWQGDLSGSNSTPSILMDVDKAVTAVFTLKDSDQDGISDQEEDSGPNSGDENNDQIPDAQQANVVSLKSYDNQYHVVLTSSGATTLSAVQAIANPHPEDCPDWADFDYGFFRFTIAGVPAGGSASVTIKLPDGASVNGYYKYGPIPGDADSRWYRFKYEDSTGIGAQFNGNEITMHFIDGDLGDDDLTADGTIHDDGAPGWLDNDSRDDPPDTNPGGSGSGGGGGCFIDTVR